MPRPKKTESLTKVKKKTSSDKVAKTTKKSEKTEKVKKTVTKIDLSSIEPNPEKKDIIVQFQVKEGDTGSPEVQIALLTKRIEKLVMHLKTNPQDNHSRRGLLGIVSKRRRLLNYLEKRDEQRYKDVLKKLNLSK